MGDKLMNTNSLPNTLRAKRSSGLASLLAGFLTLTCLSLVPAKVDAHGDVAPQAVDTSGLPELSDEWLEENPWRNPDNEHWSRAIEVGASGYNQNCARCHGLGAVSGGLAPDLRLLEADIDGDEWYLERFQHGYTQNGTTKMPAFGELLGQEAGWAIRTYLETRPDEGALDNHVTTLKEIRDTLKQMAASDQAPNEADLAPLRSKMMEIATQIETGSGAPRADSVAAIAAAKLDGTQASIKSAIDALTIGLSAAQ